MKYAKYIFFAVLAGLAALYLYNRYRVAPGMDFNKLTLTDVDGNPFQWKSLEGKKVLVSFGASWCVNCREEMQLLNKIKSKDLSDVTIVIISDEPLERVKSFSLGNGYPFLFLKMEQSFPSIGVNSIPVNYIVNRKLQVTYEEVGAIDWEDSATLEHMKKLME
jgi:thiol-disulfide isomerase/thioredoxin